MGSVKSKVFLVRPDSPSMKGTIPLPIVEALKLEHGDKLDWQVEARNGGIVAVVKKAEFKVVSHKPGF